MKLVSYNIQYGFGSDTRYDLSRAARLVAGADIIALQEVERHWQRSNFDDQPEVLSRLLPGYHWVYGPAFDMDASEWRDGHLVNRRRQFGT
ncbi:MAG: EEP domain-containing protein, partial [Mesorhizobium sp.]